MPSKYLFNFKSDISNIRIPSKLNNPFGIVVPEIARVAAKEFQEFIEVESKNWKHDFSLQKGKMFGVLVVQKEDNTLEYLGTISGKLPENAKCNQFVPSVFDDSVGNYFINKGMTELTEIGLQIKTSTSSYEIITLKEKRKQQSIALQQRLFENYHFLNFTGKSKNLLEIFESSSHAYPPSAAGECAAPKLLQYAIQNELKPIALAEFWWGSSIQNKEMIHADFYPACKDRCRPILEYMLEDSELYDRRENV
jgi:tRNA pseudouridine32 synthase/23S rRNA pseudouridine746 synthase